MLLGERWILLCFWNYSTGIFNNLLVEHKFYIPMQVHCKFGSVLYWPKIARLAKCNSNNFFSLLKMGKICSGFHFTVRSWTCLNLIQFCIFRTKQNFLWAVIVKLFRIPKGVYVLTVLFSFTELPDRSLGSTSQQLLPISSRDKDSKNREELDKFRNGNSANITTWVWKTSKYFLLSHLVWPHFVDANIMCNACLQIGRPTNQKFRDRNILSIIWYIDEQHKLKMALLLLKVLSCFNRCNIVSLARLMNVICIIAGNGMV